jgi:hypothetical protein
MKRFVKGLMGVAFAGIAAYAALAPAAAQNTGTTKVKWNSLPVLSFTLTPNYYTGFGQVKAVFGTQPTPTHGPNAGPGVGQGDIDFGNLLAGTTYLYKYAVHLNVTSNDSNGFEVYGEGAAAFYNQTDASSQPLNSTLFYVTSTSGTPADPNTGFSAGLPFQQTGGIVTPAQPNYAVAPSINYGGVYPSVPIVNNASPSGDFYYDYLLKVPPLATQGQYFVWIVYTVVAK